MSTSPVTAESTKEIPGKAEAAGSLCNDPNGLLLASDGSIPGSENSGTYTSLLRLAAQLESSGGEASPLVTIETKSTSIVLKEYEGHAVAASVARENPKAENGN